MDQTTRIQVEKILKSNVRARSSDKLLLMDYIERNTNFKNLPPKVKQSLAKILIHEMPAFETITRWRRDFQKNGLYPADVKTRTQRKALEKAVRMQFK